MWKVKDCTYLCFRSRFIFGQTLSANANFHQRLNVIRTEPNIKLHVINNAIRLCDQDIRVINRASLAF